MAVTEVVETERKYEVDDAARVPELSTVAGITEVHVESPVTLRAVYFDTEEGALASAGFTLRRREGGHDAGWHLKTPSPLGRTEHRVALESGSPRPPRELVDLVTAWTRRHSLVEVAHITTERTAIVVFTQDDSGANAAAAEIADDRVSATDLRTGTLRLWREWEVESLMAEGAGNGPVLEAIGKALLDVGAVPSASHSKLARALGRTRLDPATSASGGKNARVSSAVPGVADTALGAVVVILAQLREAILVADRGVRTHNDDAVHQMRIVVRRLRSVLAAFRGILDRDTLDALRDRLSQLGAVLGDVRDAEVRQKRAQALVSATHTPGPHTGVETVTAVQRRLLEDTEAEHRTLHATLIDYLATHEYFALLDDVDELVARPPLTGTSLYDARTALRAALHRESRRARRRVKRADRTDLSALHRARKAARRLRYVAEALSSGESAVLGTKTRALGEAAEAVQDVLGEHRDATLFAERLERAAEQAEHADQSAQSVQVGQLADDYAALAAEERQNARIAAEALGAAVRTLTRAARA